MQENILIECQDKLKQAKRDFDEFVYLVSHDLKAPIRAITNLAGWIEEDLGNEIPADVKHNMQLLRDRSHRLEKMLEAILLLSRIPRTDLEIKAIAISDFIQNISAAFEDENIKIKNESDLPTITTYHQKLKTVLEQLLKNAIIHANSLPIEITVKGQVQAEFLQISIADNGPGIEAHQKDRIFNIFFTGNGLEGNKNIGAGLTLVKHILDFVGGNIELQKQVAIGSTFLINWPLNITQKP